MWKIFNFSRNQVSRYGNSRSSAAMA